MKANTSRHVDGGVAGSKQLKSTPKFLRNLGTCNESQSSLDKAQRDYHEGTKSDPPL